MSKKPSLPDTYVLPSVWSPPAEDSGAFSSVNRPTAGKRFDAVLPRGAHPIQLHSLATPNGQKVTILLEELGVEYDAWPIDILKGQQFGSEFVELNPNSKIPAMYDYSHTPPLRVFESVSILLYLAEKYEKFIPKNTRDKTEMMNWLIWQVGTAPYLGGGFGHFYKYAPVNIEYAINRFSMESKRILHVLELHLEGKNYVVGEEYSLADIAIFPWVQGMYVGYNAGDFLQLQDYKNIIAWKDRILSRPAVKRGLRVNKPWDDGIPERHSAADFE